MNPISFLNPYQMALIDLEYCYAADLYAKEYKSGIDRKINEYLVDFATPYYNARVMPTIETIRDIHIQARILYRITTDKDFPKRHVSDCILLLAERAVFPLDNRIQLAYYHLVNECVSAIRTGHDSLFADKEKCEVFVRHGWLSEKARYPECITARHEPRYEVFYKEDFAIYEETVANDCVCT